MRCFDFGGLDDLARLDRLKVEAGEGMQAGRDAAAAAAPVDLQLAYGGAHFGAGELQARGRSEHARVGRRLQAFVLGDQGFGLEVENGAIRVYRGATGDPDARIETDVDTLGALVYEGGDLDDALRSGNVEIDGDRSAVERLMGVFPLPEPAPKPTVTRQG